MAKQSKKAGWFLALGLLLLLFGFIIMIFPVAGTFALETFFGLLLLLSGIVFMVFSFMTHEWEGFLFTLLAGIVYLVTGFLLLAFPLQGVVSLTLLLGAFLLVSGVLKSALSTRLKDHKEWVLFDGVITVLLGILVVAAWPSDASWVIGLLFGINMLFGGISFLLLYLAARE